MDNYETDIPPGANQEVLRALAYARTKAPMENSVRASILGTILEALVLKNREFTRIPWAEENSLLDLAREARYGCIADDGNHIDFENLVLSELKMVFTQIGQSLRHEPDLHPWDRRNAENLLIAAMDFNAAAGPKEKRRIDPHLRKTDWHTPYTALHIANETISLIIPRIDKEFIRIVKEDFPSMKILDTGIYCESVRSRFTSAHDFTDTPSHAKLNSAHRYLKELYDDLENLCAAQVAHGNKGPHIEDLDFTSLNQLLYYLQSFDPHMAQEKYTEEFVDDNVVSLSERRQENARRELRRLLRNHGAELLPAEKMDVEMRDFLPPVQPRVGNGAEPALRQS